MSPYSYFSSLLNQPHYIPLIGWSCISFSGKDSKTWLQGQLTNDIEVLAENSFQMQARLDRNGRVQSFGIFFKTKNHYKWLVPKSTVERIVEDLKNYIISEEVTINSEDTIYSLCSLSKHEILGNANIEASLLAQKMPSSQKFKEFLNSSGYYFLFEPETCLNKLINNTYLGECAISYNKGCFLGQEPVAKIESRRGPANYPHIFKAPKNFEKELWDEKFGKILTAIWDEYFIAQIKREYRIEGYECLGGEIKNIPLVNFLNKKEMSRAYFQLAIDLYHEEKQEEAIKNLGISIELDPENADSYEMLGVIHGNSEDYSSAIELMNKLSEINPDSVMALTNKSLYYMKMGEIEKAEEMKAQATLKTFEYYGKESERKELEEKKQREERENAISRMEMFKEVLVIDSEDLIALNGLGECYLVLQDWAQAEEKFKKALSINEKHSISYLNLAKALARLERREELKEVLNKGIKIAASNGDLQPANKMKSLLNLYP